MEADDLWSLVLTGRWAKSLVGSKQVMIPVFNREVTERNNCPLQAREKYFSFYPMFSVIKGNVDIPKQQQQIEAYRQEMGEWTHWYSWLEWEWLDKKSKFPDKYVYVSRSLDILKQHLKHDFAAFTSGEKIQLFNDLFTLIIVMPGCSWISLRDQGRGWQTARILAEFD